MTAVTDDVHRRRRLRILEEHPSIRKLYGHDPRTQFYAYFVVILQLVVAYFCRESWSRAVLLGCTVGPYLDAFILCFIHEATHMLVFAKPAYNRLISIFANMVMIMPLSEIFKQHHNAHHRNLGNDSFDVDMPTDLEIEFVGNSSARKALWLMFNMIILPIRSITRLPVVFDRFLLTNWLVCMAFGVLTYMYSRSCFLYLILSLLQSQGLHPANTRQVQRHVFNGNERMRQASDTRAPTYSYYGWQNAITLNVGWHIEHHDFPHVPWSRLPQIRHIAGRQWYPEQQSHVQRGMSNLNNFVFNSNISLADFGH